MLPLGSQCGLRHPQLVVAPDDDIQPVDSPNFRVTHEFLGLRRNLHRAVLVLDELEAVTITLVGHEGALLTVLAAALASRAYAGVDHAL